MSNWVMKLLLALCAGCYAGAFVCSLERFEKKLRPAWKWVFTGSALALNTGLVVYNYIINRITNGASYAPFVSMFQVLIFLALTFTPVWLFVEKVCRYKGYHWYFLLASAIVMLGPCFMDIHAVWTFPPALQSVFFVPHVICYMLSYSLAAIAFLIAFVSLFSGRGSVPAVYGLCFPSCRRGCFSAPFGRIRSGANSGHGTSRNAGRCVPGWIICSACTATGGKICGNTPKFWYSPDFC